MFPLVVTFVSAHAATFVGVGGFLLSQAGTTMPDLGTTDFWKVWAHDYFRAITASRSQKKV